MKLLKQSVTLDAQHEFARMFRQGIKVIDKDIHIINSGYLTQIYERPNFSFSRLFKSQKTQLTKFSL